MKFITVHQAWVSGSWTGNFRKCFIKFWLSDITRILFGYVDMLARLMKHGYRICMIFFFFKIGSNCFVSLRASRLSFGISFGFASRRFRGFITRLRLLGSQINNAIMTYYVAADNKQCCIIVVKMAADLKRTRCSWIRSCFLVSVNVNEILSTFGWKGKYGAALLYAMEKKWTESGKVSEKYCANHSQNACRVFLSQTFSSFTEFNRQRVACTVL